MPRTLSYHSRLRLTLGHFAIAAALVCEATLAGRCVGAAPEEYCEILVVDSQTGRGIPLVELVTVDQVRYVTDNAGRIAYREPGHDGQTVFFDVFPQGYDVPVDGLGIRGVRLTIRPGEVSRVELRRVNVAERLYRCTGAGLYRDSVLLGHDTPLDQPLGAGRVAGQDSVQAVPYRGQLYWFWGDTSRLAYPLGLFRTAGATSLLPDKGGLGPDLGINFRYFTNDEGFVRAMAEVPDARGVVWIDGVCTVNDTTGRERLLAHFSRRPGLAEQYEQGVLAYNDQREIFEPVAPLPLEESWRFLHGHPIHWRDDGQDYLLMGNPFSVTRVRATWHAVLDPRNYESWTCLETGDDPATADPRRDAAGRLDYRWRSAPPVTPREEARWLAAGLIRADELRWLPTDAVAPQQRVTMHSGTVRWNAHRERWILIATEFAQRADSPSVLGEVWYSEATSPLGPFATAVRIVSHDKQTFYNPCQHAFFDQDQGRTVYFEGTYCNTFTASPATQRYNYNQVMYRLDLDDPRLHAAFPP